MSSVGSFQVGENQNTSCHFAYTVGEYELILHQLEKFCPVEKVNQCEINSLEENKREQLFINTVMRDETGRFCFMLPLTENVKHLGHSKQMAVKRFYHLEKN